MRQFDLPESVDISSPLAWRQRHVTMALRGLSLQRSRPNG
jgi:hypothetical protein